jgi:hypothetical protein
VRARAHHEQFCLTDGGRECGLGVRVYRRSSSASHCPQLGISLSPAHSASRLAGLGFSV